MLNRIEIEEERYIPGNFTYESDRPLRGITLWFSINLLGLTKYRQHLEEKRELTKYLYSKLQEMPNLEMGPFPQTLVVCFRLKGTFYDNINNKH